MYGALSQELCSMGLMITCNNYTNNNYNNYTMELVILLYQ